MKIHVNGICLAYEKSGGGAPLILLHGNGEDRHIFGPLAQKLARHFTVYAIDSRNHGESGRTDDFSYSTMAQDILAFINTLDLGNVFLAGFSDGAIISLVLAMKHPAVVDKMALLGVNLSPGDFTDESYDFIKTTYEQTSDPLFNLMLTQPNITLEQVKNVDTPTLIIGAENDVFNPETFTNLAAAMPNAQLLIMKGHTHDSYVAENDILYSDLIGFFEVT